MKTYRELLEEQTMIEKQIQIMHNLSESGLPKSNLHIIELPIVESGYSMGETVVILCNGKEIAKYDNCKEYSRSCKYRAKHGLVVVDFTKKALKQLLELSYQWTKETDSQKRIDCWTKYKEIVLSCIDYERSIMRAKKGEHIYVDTKHIDEFAKN